MKKNTLFNYLLRMQCIYFFLALILIIFIIFSIDLVGLIRRISAKKLVITMDIVYLSIFNTFYIINTLIPYVFLLSNTLAFKKLNQTDQMTILKNLGYSIYDMVIPSILIGVVVGILNIIIMHPIISEFNDKARKIEYKVFNKKLPSIGKSELWVQQKQNGQDLIIYIDKFNGDNLSSVVIYMFNDPVNKQIIAENAVIKNNGTWLLKKGAIIKKDTKVEHFEEKLIANSINQEHLAMYYRNPMNSDIFTLINVLNLRKNAGLHTEKYVFQINLLLSKILMPSIMALFAILFCYTHHRYAYKSLSTLAILIFGFVIHFTSQVLQSFGMNYPQNNAFINWIFIFFLYFVIVLAANYKDRN